MKSSYKGAARLISLPRALADSFEGTAVGADVVRRLQSLQARGGAACRGPAAADGQRIVSGSGGRPLKVWNLAAFLSADREEQQGD
jgi:hypothetical protein